MSRYEGVRPHKSQAGQARPEKWEIDTGKLVTPSGVTFPRKRKIVKAVNARQASELRLHWISQLLAQGPQPTKEKRKGPPAPTVEEYSEKYYLPWVLENQTPSTYGTKKDVLKRHLIPLLGHVKMDKAGDYTTIEKLKSYIKAKDWTKSTRNSVLLTYTNLLGHASRPETAPRGKPLLVKPRVTIFKDRTLQKGEQRAHQSGFVLGKDRHKRLDDDQVESLLAVCIEDKDYALIGLGLFVGLRRGEIAAVKWADVDWEKNRINIHAHISERDHQHREWVKNGVPGYIPLEATLRACLDRLYEKAKDKSGYILPSTYDGHMSVDQIYTRFQRLAKKAWGKECKPGPIHALRHTFCSRLADAGIRPETIQILARHKAIATTYGYIRPDESQIEAAGLALSFESQPKAAE